MTIREITNRMKLRLPLHLPYVYMVFVDPGDGRLFVLEMDYQNTYKTDCTFLFCTHGNLRMRDVRARVENACIEKGVKYYMNGNEKVNLCEE